MARAPDSYEEKYMGADEAIAHREKIAYPKWFRLLVPLLLTIAFGVAGVGAAVGHEWFAAAMMALAYPASMLGWLVMSTLRVTVTSENLHVQYGLFGPSIPLSAIEHCEAEHYSVWKYGGYGIRYSVTEGAWCYNMIGDRGQAVRVHWRDEKGKLRKTLIASEDHVGLANAINEQRARAHATDVVVDDGVIHAEEYGFDAAELAAQEIEESVVAEVESV